MKALSLMSPLAFVAALAVFTPAFAGEPDARTQSEFRIELSGRVPVLCRVSIDNTIVPNATGLVSLGKMTEFCNNPTGYRVVLVNPVINGPATLIVDGREIPLGAQELVLVSQSAGAAVAEHRVELQRGEAGAVGTLAFRIEPL